MHRIQYELGWRIVNLLFLIAGMLMPWFLISFDPLPAGSKPISGLDHMLALIGVEVDSLSRYRLDLGWAMGLLELMSLAWVATYLVMAAVQILRGKISHSKMVALALLMAALLFSFNDAVLRSRIPLIGFWLFTLGLISSAICEWLNFSTDS